MATPVIGSYHGYGSSEYNSHGVEDVACHSDEGHEHGSGAVIDC
jgi:hypothetical protein